MSEMGRYCKAYQVKELRSFPGWRENIASLRKEVRQEDGEEVEIERTELRDEDVLYLQENFVVTDGIFKDENIVFEDTSGEWKEFCRKDLEFEIPVFEPIQVQADSSAEASDSA